MQGRSLSHSHFRPRLGRQAGPETQCGHSAGVRRPDVLITLFFIAVFLVQLVHHQLWRDELNAFALARASPSISSLIRHIHYEGHPWLWYFVLWVAAHLSPSVVVLKLVQASFVVSAYIVLGLFSPFSRVERALIFSSYFISFEYAVISRMYCVLVLLSFLYARERSLHPERALRIGFLLGLMASTDIMGMILSGAFLVEYAVSRWFSRERPEQASYRRMTGAMALYLGMVLLAILSAKTAPDISWRTTGHPLAAARDPRHFVNAVLAYTVLPYFPIAYGRSVYSYWNALPEQHRAYLGFCLPVVLMAYWRIFRERMTLLLLLGTAVVLAICFGHLIYIGTIRHNGVTFIAFIVGLWILRSGRARLPPLAIVLLGLSASSGFYVAYAQWQRPFSNAQAAAAWLRQNNLDRDPVIGTPDTSVISIAELLNRPMYMLDCECSDTFLLFSNRRDSFVASQISDRIVDASKRFSSEPMLYIGVLPFTAQQLEEVKHGGLRVSERAQWTDAAIWDENFYIYQLSPAATEGGSNVEQ